MQNSHIYLEQLLEQLSEQPERQAEITQTIDNIFGQEKAVLVLDMSGFCRTAREQSIIFVLSMIQQMRRILTPCVEKQGGQLIKAEADNLFCLFDTVADALQACGEMQNCLIEANKTLPEHCRLDVSIGIGYGYILNIENKDLFGDEVNLASKLGEDIARAGEILLTENALARLHDSASCVQEKTIEISGFSLRYHVINANQK